MKHTPKQWKITGFIPLMAVVLFAFCLMGVLLTGAKVYRQLVTNDQAAYDRRTAQQYVTTRVRQADAAGSISAEDLEGISALLLKEQIDGKNYITYVYCYEGNIRELYVEEGYDFEPEDGEIILGAEKLSFTWKAPALSVHILFEDGDERSFTLMARSQQEETL